MSTPPEPPFRARCKLCGAAAQIIVYLDEADPPRALILCQQCADRLFDVVPTLR